MKHLLVIDNYDSFTYNLVQLFSLFDLTITVHRSDRVTVADVAAARPDCILISPGPKTPAHAGISVELVRSMGGRVPILGVCLGMQCINEAFGGATVRCPVPVHGKTSPIYHDGDHVFADIPSPFTAARYHSLMVRQNGNALRVSATTSDNVIMGLRHPDLPIFGVQFHPESFLTEHGRQMAENFLAQG
ncbi:MAG: anthranilate synthase component II [Thermodesulfobacteriota bacterium]